MNNKFLLLGNIVFLPILCVLLIFFFKTFIDFQFIITFALLIIVFNKNKIKHRFIWSLLYSIILSFLVLTLSMAVGKVIYIIKDELFIDLMSNNFFKWLHIIPKSIVSPLLMFYSYKLLFKIEKVNFFKVVKWSSVFVLILFGLTKAFFKNECLFMSWQFVMALALQLILYQNKLNVFLKSK